MFEMDSLYQPNPRLTSRSISFENPTGGKAGGGHAASPLGQGRKGDPARQVEAGASLCLADIEGPGTIRHVWVTTRPSRTILRGVMIRIFWENATFPSVEMPLGEFFGFAHGSTPPFQTALHSVGKRYGMNTFVPMPFTQRARTAVVSQQYFERHDTCMDIHAFGHRVLDFMLGGGHL